MLNLGRSLLPESTDAPTRARAGLVIYTCLGIVGASAALVVTWLLTGDLDPETPVAALALALLLAGLALLARSGRVTWAAGGLTALLFLLVTADAWAFGLASPAAAAYCLPVTLAACALGLWAGLGVALTAGLSLWLLAWGAVAGWHSPWGPVEVSHLTFNAPFYTVILLLLALMIGGWARTLTEAA